MTPFGFEAPGSVAEGLVSDLVSVLVVFRGVVEAAGFRAMALLAFGSAAAGVRVRTGSGAAVGGASGSGGATATVAAGASGAGESGAGGRGAVTVAALGEDCAVDALPLLSLPTAKAATPSSARTPNTRGSLLRLRIRGPSVSSSAEAADAGGMNTGGAASGLLRVWPGMVCAMRARSGLGWGRG